MDDYRVEQKGLFWHISKDGNKPGIVVAKTTDYEIAKYIYYGPLLKRTLKTVKRLLKNVRESRTRKKERVVIDITIEELGLIVRLLENGMDE